MQIWRICLVKEHGPFGKGPWLCLNAVCSNYHKPVVTDLTITRCYDTGNPVGTFRCDCGFVFHEEDLIKIKKIITALVQ